MSERNAVDAQSTVNRGLDGSALPPTGFKLNIPRAALVGHRSPERLSECGWSWMGHLWPERHGEQLRLLILSCSFGPQKPRQSPFLISPHYYYPTDHQWNFGGGVEKLMHKIRMFDRTGPLTLENFEGSGADFLSVFKPYIHDGKTIVASPPQDLGPSNE